MLPAEDVPERTSRCDRAHAHEQAVAIDQRVLHRTRHVQEHRQGDDPSS